MIPWKLSELLSQTEALFDILGRDKVGSNLCARLHEENDDSARKLEDFNSKMVQVKEITNSLFTLRFLTWWGHPAGIKTASPKCCSNVHGSIPAKFQKLCSTIGYFIKRKKNSFISFGMY